MPMRDRQMYVLPNGNMINLHDVNIVQYNESVPPLGLNENRVKASVVIHLDVPDRLRGHMCIHCLTFDTDEEAIRCRDEIVAAVESRCSGPKVDPVDVSSPATQPSDEINPPELWMLWIPPQEDVDSGWMRPIEGGKIDVYIAITSKHDADRMAAKHLEDYGILCLPVRVL